MNNPKIDANGTKKWYNEKGEYHRLDGPAIEFANGSKYWYQNGLRHREDGPAVENASGSVEFWEYGKQIKKRTIYDEFKTSMVSYE